MLFQNPIMLWGMLAVAVPIALHFWHQQQAKPIPWAMLRWLETPNQPPKRGLRFDNLWLLLLRCLLLLLLALLLARPEWPQPPAATQGAVHLIEPNRQVFDGFRFELQQARQRGDRLFWATDTPTPVDEAGTLPPSDPLNPLRLQAAIEQVQTPQTKLHLYIRNTPDWNEAPTISVPAGFVLHALPAKPASGAGERVIGLANGRFLGTSEAGRLTVFSQKTTDQPLIAMAPLPVLVQFRQPDERHTVRAALAALTAAYGLTFAIDEQAVAGKTYRWVLTDRPVDQPTPTTLYLTTAAPVRPDLPGVTHLTGPLTTGNPMVANGQLPEQLGNALVTGLGLSASTSALPGSAFARLFVPVAEGGTKALAGVSTGRAVGSMPLVPTRNALQTGLFVLFLSLLLAERWWALRRGV